MSHTLKIRINWWEKLSTWREAATPTQRPLLFIVLCRKRRNKSLLLSLSFLSFPFFLLLSGASAQLALCFAFVLLYGTYGNKLRAHLQSVGQGRAFYVVRVCMHLSLSLSLSLQCVHPCESKKTKNNATTSQTSAQQREAISGAISPPVGPAAEHCLSALSLLPSSFFFSFFFFLQKENKCCSMLYVCI